MTYRSTLRGLASLMLISLLLAATTASKKLMADKKTSSVTYTMHHPLHTWDAVSHDVNCAIMYDEATKTITSVAVAIKIASFDSKDSNRDSHAMEVLDGIRYPNVTFVSQSIQTGADGTLTATGKLTFHGVTRPTVLVCTRKGDGNNLIVTGDFAIRMTDFAIEQPSLLGMKADDAIKLKFTAYFNE
ncbi:YceI family protein [Spirosoma sp. HMF3257]|uniref:YceI family protein n=1 Tax=Spirosoma telluris TaxID=2183553 RepID=A0A327NPZ0_9BACT|nr:YceI family protein [Spirosoma telluris]RAI75854.1 YceI family protein [Spirosoma telluris]